MLPDLYICNRSFKIPVYGLDLLFNLEIQTKLGQDRDHNLILLLIIFDQDVSIKKAFFSLYFFYPEVESI